MGAQCSEGSKEVEAELPATRAAGVVDGSWRLLE